MAGDAFPELKIDDAKVLAKFRSLPERLRAKLRQVIPPVTQMLADTVRAKLRPGSLGTSAQTGLPLFRTTDRLLPAVTARMVENSQGIVGRVFVDPDKFSGVAAMSLESGARPHVIEARNASALFFFWDKMGKNVALRRVNHPGFPGAFYMRDSLKEKRAEISAAITSAVTDEVRS